MVQPYVINRGTTATKGMIIGEAPGREEEEVGKPFVGASGRLLDLVFEDLDADTNDYYITNVYKLRPENNRTPTKEEIEAHLPALVEEIKYVKPRVILALGVPAQQTLVRIPFEPMHKLLFAWHPAYVLRQRTKYPTWRDNQIGRFLDAVY